MQHAGVDRISAGFQVVRVEGTDDLIAVAHVAGAIRYQQVHTKLQGFPDKASALCWMRRAGQGDSFAFDAHQPLRIPVSHGAGYVTAGIA